MLTPEGIRVHPARPQSPFPAHFKVARRSPPNQELAERFGKMVKAGVGGELVDTLRLVEPRLTRLDTVSELGESVLHGDVGVGAVVSIPAMGDGTMKLADLVLTIREARGGGVPIDEYENGLHYSVLQEDRARRLGETLPMVVTAIVGMIGASLLGLGVIAIFQPLIDLMRAIA